MYSTTIRVMLLLVSDVVEYFIDLTSLAAALTDNKRTTDDALLRTLTRSTDGQMNNDVCVSMLGEESVRRRVVNLFSRLLVTHRRSVCPTTALRSRHHTAR